MTDCEYASEIEVTGKCQGIVMLKTAVFQLTNLRTPPPLVTPPRLEINANCIAICVMLAKVRLPDI